MITKKAVKKSLAEPKPVKVAAPKPRRICMRCKKAPVQFPRSKRCLPCQKDVRRLQLKRNNKAWWKRIEDGEAGHRLVYAGKPTEYALSKASLTKKAEKFMATKKVAPKPAAAAKKAVAPKAAAKGKVPPAFLKKAKGK